MLQVNHRHVIFTVDEGLRVIFQKHRKLLKDLMNEAVRIIQECNQVERIPLKVVISFDEMDDGDLTVPPQFSCEKCGRFMYPEYFKGIHGYEYVCSLGRCSEGIFALGGQTITQKQTAMMRLFAC